MSRCQPGMETPGSPSRLRRPLICCWHHLPRTRWMDPKQSAQRGWGDSSPRTHPGLSAVYFHSWRNLERQIASGQESRQVKLGLTHDTPTICKGRIGFYRINKSGTARSRWRRADTPKLKSANLEKGYFKKRFGVVKYTGITKMQKLKKKKEILHKQQKIQILFYDRFVPNNIGLEILSPSAKINRIYNRQIAAILRFLNKFLCAQSSNKDAER